MRLERNENFEHRDVAIGSDDEDDSGKQGERGGGTTMSPWEEMSPHPTWVSDVKNSYRGRAVETTHTKRDGLHQNTCRGKNLHREEIQPQKSEI